MTNYFMPGSGPRPFRPRLTDVSNEQAASSHCGPSSRDEAEREVITDHMRGVHRCPYDHEHKAKNDAVNCVVRWHATPAHMRHRADEGRKAWAILESVGFRASARRG